MKISLEHSYNKMRFNDIAGIGNYSTKVISKIKMKTTKNR